MPESLVSVADREDKEKGVRRARDEGEELGLVDGEDVVELKSAGEAEILEESGHYFGVVFWEERRLVENAFGGIGGEGGYRGGQSVCAFSWALLVAPLLSL